MSSNDPTSVAAVRRDAADEYTRRGNGGGVRCGARRRVAERGLSGGGETEPRPPRTHNGAVPPLRDLVEDHKVHQTMQLGPVLLDAYLALPDHRRPWVAALGAAAVAAFAAGIAATVTRRASLEDEILAGVGLALLYAATQALAVGLPAVYARGTGLSAAPA